MRHYFNSPMMSQIVMRLVCIGNATVCLSFPRAGTGYLTWAKSNGNPVMVRENVLFLLSNFLGYLFIFRVVNLIPEPPYLRKKI